MNNATIKQIKEFLLNFNYKQLYWLLEMGRPIRKADTFFLRNNNFSVLNKPVFFLSTGRTGTMWFAKFFNEDKNSKAFHFAPPDLAIQSKIIYKYKDDIFDEKSDVFELIKEMFLAAREEYFIYSYKTNKRYIETNNHLAFFAPIIAKLIPDAVFIHVYRHPGEFVKSGLRREWYQNDNLSELKLIAPNENKEWDGYSQIKKIAWLWNEINSFIENFKKNIDPERYFEFNFSELNVENVKKLVDFTGLNISDNYINKNIGKKENVQKTGGTLSYSEWNEKDKEELKNICGELAEKYGYKL